MLDVLRQIIQAVNSAENLQAALDTMVEQVGTYLNTDATTVYLADQRHAHFILVASRGYNPNIAGISVRTDQGLVGLVGQREEPMNLENAQLHPQYYRLPGAGEEKYKAFLGVPIIHQRHVLGVMAVQQKEERKFSETEETFLITISAQIAGVIAHAEATGDISQLTGSYALLEDTVLSGQAGAAGVAMGTAVVVYPLANLLAVPDQTIEDVDKEIQFFRKALAATRKEMEGLGGRLAHLPTEDRALFDAYLKMLDNKSLGIEVEEHIQQKQWAQGALKRVIKEHVRQFEAMDDLYLRERAADLRDLGNRVLMHLQKEKKTQIRYPPNTILVGDEVTAARLAEVPRDRLAGLICTRGSANAHVAIIARSMGIPAVLGIRGFSLSQIDGHQLIVDGYNGRIHISPSSTLQNEFKRIIAEEKELFAGLDQLRELPSQTPDGKHIPLYINTGIETNNQAALEMGAEGVGLYRTEMAFMLRDGFPSEEEQRIIYRQLLRDFSPHKVTIRTLDVGGDKSLPYFPIEEDNPYLGWRGIRITLDHPEIFLVQVRAMLRACAQDDNLQILLPMITNVTEVEESLRLITQAYCEILEEGTKIVMPRVGVMIEVPSAVYQVRRIAQRVDFLSIGSNDLTQYLLAVDRNNSRVANLYDSLDPAIIAALMQIVEGAHQEGKPVTLCGEMASDPAAMILLMAMGIDGISMNTASLLKIKWVIRNITLAKAKDLLSKALEMTDAAAIRHMLNEALDGAGLGGLIRAGK